MRRSRGSSPPSPFRALAHHHAQHGGSQRADSVSSMLRSFNVETNPTRPMRPSPLTASTIPDMPLDLVDRIRSFPLFMSAPDDFLAAIGKHLRPQIHAPRDHILTEGDDAKAMYWLVRGAVAVTSRDGEAVYAELKPGAFFGEIGVLMDMPRTATIVARTKCLLVVLKKEDLHAELPRYPDMEKAIRQEAQERLTILKKKQQERRPTYAGNDERQDLSAEADGTANNRSSGSGENGRSSSSSSSNSNITNSKKRKSPSPGVIEDPAVGGSVLGSGYVNVRKTLRELPLFSALPPDILHFLGLSAQPKSYAPFTDIIRQGSRGNDIFFIISGEVEVIHEAPGPPSSAAATEDTAVTAREIRRGGGVSFARPRLVQGQYFGEVASLGLSPGRVRTATVRSITSVECLMISGEALDELWRRCPPGLKLQVEETARERYRQAGEADELGDGGGGGDGGDADVEMRDSREEGEEEAASRAAGATGDGGGGGDDDNDKASTTSLLRRPSVPHVTFTTPSKPSSPTKEEAETRQPSDPDPFLSVDMENLRNRRRNSLAPPSPQVDSSSPSSSSSSPSSSGAQTTSTTTTSSLLQTSENNSSPLKLFTFPPLSSPLGESSSAAEGKEAKNLETVPSVATVAPVAPVMGVMAEEESNMPRDRFKKARTFTHRPYEDEKSSASPVVSPSISTSSTAETSAAETVLVGAFLYLDIVELIRLRAVCREWKRILTTSRQLCRRVDLSELNRVVNDWSVSQVIAPFVGQRAVEMDISNCFHITDEGFQTLWRLCGRNVRVWRMKSVWDVSASQILDMSENAKELEELDWSNCRKVGDNLLARVVGWVVPGVEEGPQQQQQQQSQVARKPGPKTGVGTSPGSGPGNNHVTGAKTGPAPGTVIGCPRLSVLDLSYCKHITDRSMMHLAAHASERLRSLTLTRCTSITDAGFQAWAPYRFRQLTRLCLADCTYLSDNAVVSLVNAAKGLTHLDLSFCCALSDTATEVVALGLPMLRDLRLAFCGSAVSDASLRCVALHLNDLRGLSVRGCVRVTGVGLEHVLDGCARLDWLDASQCKNLAPWLADGGIARWGYDDRERRPAALCGSATTTTTTTTQPSSASPSSTWTPPGWSPDGLYKGAGLAPLPSMRGQRRRARKPVRFIVEKGACGGLR